MTISNEVAFADTTIRDGTQSLWASSMRTGMMLAVAADLDAAGFEAIETSFLDPRKSVRELKEDPWERLRLLGRHITRTPLRGIAGRLRPFSLTPPVLFEIFMECYARNGVRQVRISDECNNVDLLRWKVKAARDVGLVPIVNLIFSQSPKHTDEYYAERARAVAAMGVWRLCLKDPGGLLTPDRLRTLVPVVLRSAGDRQVELHSHCTTGLGTLNAIEAVKLGIRVISIGIPPLANGTALPSLFSLAHNLRALGYAPRYEEEPARRVERRLMAIAEAAGLPAGRPLEYDAAQYAHQIPGGMLTNLRHQLKLVGLEDKYDATLEECARVREEWGYPIMVTPLSQFVGSQAALNVIVGERYAQVTDQAIHYALGRWGGQETIDGMDPEARARILDRPRARELAAWQPPQPTADEVRRAHGGPGISDEEMLLRMDVLESEIAAMRAAGPPREYPDADQPLVTLVRGLAEQKHGFIRVERGDTLVILRRSSET